MEFSLFSCKICDDDIINYYKTFKNSLPSDKTYSSISSVREYIHNNEQRRLDLDGEGIWNIP